MLFKYKYCDGFIFYDFYCKVPEYKTAFPIDANTCTKIWKKVAK